MRAAYYEEPGGPENLKVGERPDPEPGPGEVLIRNRAAGVGIWDVKIMASASANRSFPAIPGFEAAGVLEQAGDSGMRVGDPAYAQLGAHRGGYAEYSVARSDHVAPKPPTASFEEAAGLVIGAGTAYEGLVDRGRVQAGETVLVTAASGGVGVSAVQIAASLGARVVAVASSSNHDLLRELGASEAFDYHDPTWVDQVSAVAPGGVDVLFDGAGGDTRDRAVGAVKDGGRGVFLVGKPQNLPRGITAEQFSADPTGERLRAIGHLVEEGKLRAVMDSTFTLDDAPAAVARVAPHHSRGRVALTID